MPAQANICPTHKMRNALSYPSRKHYHGRLHILLIFFLMTVFFPSPQVWAQSKPDGTAKSSLCSNDNALEIIKQQIATTKTFTNKVQRIAILNRAADLLWTYQQDKARAVFSEAFEIAIEKDGEVDKKPQSLLQKMQIPDQRYVVIRAISRRDPIWAQELLHQILKTNSAQSSSTRSSPESLLTAARLLESAYQAVSTDLNTALYLAEASLDYPASFLLTRFLYRLAESNQQTADQFYAEALAVYGGKSIRELLYLQAYPFAWRETTNTPVYAYHEVPTNFVINQALQRRFVQVLLRRAQLALEVPLEEGDTYRGSNGNLVPGTVHLLQGLILLEPQVRETLPDLFVPLTQAREKILVSLSVEAQSQLLEPGREISIPPGQTFDERVELAQKASDMNQRDDLVANAVLSSASASENLSVVVQAIDKISDSNLRASLREWLYFQRATTAVKNKQFEEAEKLTSRLEEPDLRAFQHTEIAKGLLKGRATQTHAREVLDEAITEAKKAGNTMFAARTLLTASSLYTEIDPNRSIAVLADAINCINRIESPDFLGDDQTLEKKPERKGRGGRYAGEYSLRFYMPGTDPESAFRNLAKIDFDTALTQSSALNDKFQRAQAELGLASDCLGQALQRPKEKTKKGLTSGI